MLKLCSYHFVLFVSLTVSTLLSGAELIQTPEGALLRALPEWEELERLEVEIDGQTENLDIRLEKVEYLFTNENLCQNAAYRITTDGATELVNLNHLCQEDQPDTQTFLLVSDTQKLPEYHIKSGEFIDELIDEYDGFKFVVNAGDIVQEGTLEDWQQYREVASKYYTYRTPIIPIIGNHDYRQDPELTLPDLLYGTEHNKNHYSFHEFELFSLITLNSNSSSMSGQELAAQKTWLETMLSNRNREKPVIVVYHHAVDSTGIANIFMPGPPKYIRTNWQPLFAEQGVDLVINGHEHLYERLFKNGVNYLVAGSLAGIPGNSKLWTNKYSVFKKPKIRTLSIIQVDASGSIMLKSYDSITRELIDTHTY